MTKKETAETAEDLAQALCEFVETTFHEDPDEQLEECRAIVARLEPGEFDALCCLFEGRPAPEQQDDTEEYTLTPEWDTVGGGPCWEGEPVTFRGNLLTDFSTQYPDAQRWAVWRVYRTIRGRIVVSQAYFSLWQGERDGRTVEVYDSIQAVPVEDRDDHPHAVPVAVINQAREALGLPVGRRVE